MAGISAKCEPEMRCVPISPRELERKKSRVEDASGVRQKENRNAQTPPGTVCASERFRRAHGTRLGAGGRFGPTCELGPAHHAESRERRTTIARSRPTWTRT